MYCWGWGAALRRRRGVELPVGILGRGLGRAAAAPAAEDAHFWCALVSFAEGTASRFFALSAFKEAGVSYRRTRGELCDCRSMLCLAFLTSESSMSII